MTDVVKSASRAAELARQAVSVLNGCADPELMAFRVLLEMAEGAIGDWVYDEVHDVEDDYEDVGVDVADLADIPH